MKKHHRAGPPPAVTRLWETGAVGERLTRHRTGLGTQGAPGGEATCQGWGPAGAGGLGHLLPMCSFIQSDQKVLFHL